MKIDENTPYIVVDNRKIAPIRRIAPKVALSYGRDFTDGRPFGVVDRVTISDAAREKLRKMEVLENAGPAAVTPLKGKSETLILPSLTPPPKSKP